MKIEVGKVYKCGHEYVYINSQSSKLESWQLLFSYIGISCRPDGGESCDTFIGRFSEGGINSNSNVLALRHDLKEIVERETITILGKTLYKDEYEAAINELKEVK